MVRASIAWAKNRDKAPLYRSFARDSTPFSFSPDNAGTIKGFDAFKELVEQLFMNPAFQAVGSEFKDLQVQLSRGGDVAWYSCLLDDRNTWQGRPAGPAPGTP